MSDHVAEIGYGLVLGLLAYGLTRSPVVGIIAGILAERAEVARHAHERAERGQTHQGVRPAFALVIVLACLVALLLALSFTPGHLSAG